MIQVYSDQGSGNCYKVRLLLHQLEVPFRVVETSVLAGEQKTPEALARNPVGKVPVVELDDGTCLSESGAILYHFASGTPLWPANALDQTRTLQWMFFEQYSHEPNIAVARFWCHYLDAEEEYATPLIEKRKKGHAALKVMDDHLQEQRFLVGGRYTIADIALYAYTHVAHEGGFELEGYPALRGWLDRVASQPRHVPIHHVF